MSPMPENQERRLSNVEVDEPAGTLLAHGLMSHIRAEMLADQHVPRAAEFLIELNLDHLRYLDFQSAFEMF